MNDEIADRSGPDADGPVTPRRPGAAAGELPPVRVEPNARRRIRRALAEAGRRIAVLDDDPTGSQTVHGVDVVTVFEPDEIAAGLSSVGSTCFILTNTRSLSEADAVELNTRIGRMLFELADRLDVPIDLLAAATRPCAGTSSPRSAGWTPYAARRPAEATMACCWHRHTSRPAGSPPGTCTGPGGH